jgi:hypothetical protein
MVLIKRGPLRFEGPLLRTTAGCNPRPPPLIHLLCKEIPRKSYG